MSPVLGEDVGVLTRCTAGRAGRGGLILVSGILVRLADQAKASMIAAGVSCRVLAGPGLPCGSAEDLHAICIVSTRHLHPAGRDWK